MAAVGSRRDRHDLIADILQIARGGVLKTRIMYKAWLSSIQLNQYLEFLVEKGLLAEKKVKRNSRIVTEYRTTEKGTEFLRHKELLDKMM